MTRLRALAFLACLAAGAAFLWLGRDDRPPWHSDLANAACCLDIVHAGDLWEGRAYTNARVAARASAAEGRPKIELDFLATSDGALVTAHDWETLGGGPLTLAQTAARMDPEPFDMPALLHFIDECPRCRIVTDTKDPFGAFLDLLVAAVPAETLRTRFVVQVYSPAEGRELAARLPGQPVIFTAYKMGRVSDAALAEILALPDLMAVAMPIGWAGPLAPRVGAAAPRLPILAHGPPGVIDAAAAQRRARGAGITGIYIDARL